MRCCSSHKLFLFAAAMLAAARVFAAQSPTFHATFKTASEVAATDQSLVLLIFGAEWCAPCKALKTNTLSSRDFSERGGALRVAEVDVDSDEKSARSFGVKAVPTLILLTADGKIVARRNGYVEAAELLKWLEDGRRRAEQGQWEGTAPSAMLEDFVNKAAVGNVGDEDLKKLVTMLDRSDPGERSSIAKIILGQRESAVPLLIEAITNSYLGVRIAASELFVKLTSKSFGIDPWKAPAELAETSATLQKWWKETGKLAPADQAKPADPATLGSIKSALDKLRGNDPVERTDAMAALVNQGTAALPAVRETLKRQERSGDHRSVSLLEDVRWAILIPDSLERRASVRVALARGASPERQAAAARLGKAGREAVEPLAELVGDPDSLVAEAAMRALSGIGGKDAIPAMAALLKAADSNLRMTAAQSLGRTKNPDATKHLLAVVDDPNEVVACAALASIEEVNAGGDFPSRKDSLQPEVTAALKRCLGDTRWRVRAVAAEVAGKLRVTTLASDVEKLLDDPDAFTVKTALVALQSIGALPDEQRLAALLKRLPGMAAETLPLIMRSGSEDSVKVVTDLYNDGNTDQRLSIVRGLAHVSTERDKGADPWKALLSRAATEPNARVRRATADLLAMRPPKQAAALVGPLLSDEDPETRAAGAVVVLAVIAGKQARAGYKSEMVYFQDLDAESGFSSGFDDDSDSGSAKTNKPIATAELMASWHEGLLRHSAGTTDVRVAAAIFATGDGRDLPLFASALGRLDAKALRQFGQTPAMAAVIPKLRVPEANPLLEILTRTPSLYALAVAENAKATREVADYLLEPERFRSAIEQVSGEDLAGTLPNILGERSGAEKGGWTLLTDNDRTRAIVTGLLDSTNAAWRAAAVYSLGRRAPAKSITTFEKAIKDSNSWVRVAALQGMARAADTRPGGLRSTDTLLAKYAGELLGDPSPEVAQVAALALLENEIRKGASLDWQFEYFRYEKITVSAGMHYDPNSEERPLTAIETKPGFLEIARQRLSDSKSEHPEPFALLLAQHGEFDGIEKLIAARAGVKGLEAGTQDTLLVAIALSRDAKHIPYLRTLMASTKGEWEMRKILRAVKGMSGPEARQLRLDLNQTMRRASQ